MRRRTSLLCVFVCLGISWAGDHKDQPVKGKTSIAPQPSNDARINLGTAPHNKPRVDYASAPLSFEPNLGQSDADAHFTARSHGYTLQLDKTGARFQFAEKDKKPSTLHMHFEGSNKETAVGGESLLPGKANYFPTSDPKTWVSNVPMYSRVRYKEIYPGVDVAFYGSANRLEYDFLINPGVDPKKIRMSLSGTGVPTLSEAGDLVVSEGKASVHFLKPVVYQLASDGKTREFVQGDYELEKKQNGEASVGFALGNYDHTRQLIIDPVVDALSYSQYLLGYNDVGAVAVDNSGNAYVTGASYPAYNSPMGLFYAFEVTKFSPSGAIVYTSTYGTSNSTYVYPAALAVDSNGNASVTGYIQNPANYASVPTTANALQTTDLGTSQYESFLAVIPANGGAPTYCTYLGGSDNNSSFTNGIAVDSTGKVYVAGWTSSVTFPTTAGVYQPALATDSYYTGFVSKFDPTKSGAASLVYSTFLGSTTDAGTTYLQGIAVDSSGNAYVAAYSSNSTYPVTSGAFQYTGDYSTSGGAYVTELNPSATALVYSAHLGYGNAYGVAVDGAGSAYVTGTVAYADFPTTSGAYQTDFASGFAVKLNPGGATEAYSTFLSGPSGYTYGAVGNYPTIALPNGCASSCNAFIGGWTNSTDFPAINAIQSSPGVSGGSAFIVELNSTGTTALLSTYLGGNNTYVYQASSNGLYGNTPGIAVDSSGNIYVAGNTNYGSITAGNDFPMTIPDASTSYSFLAKISTSASAGFTLVQPTTIAFGNQSVGVGTSVSGGTMTARLSNFSSTPVTLSAITVSPSSIFSATVTAGSPGSAASCASNTVPAGGYCILDLNFTPATAGTRTGSVSITSNASNTPTTLTLTGTGVDEAIGQVSQSSLTFTTAVGTPSASQSVTITNIGDVTESTSGYVYLSQGTNFSQVNNCPTQLLPGASCTVNITFVPTQPGLFSDSLIVYNPGSIPNATVTLTGTATVTGASTGITLSAPSLQFAYQTQYTTSNQQYVYITNAGTIPVVVQSFTTSNLSFQIYNYSCGTPPYQLNPGESCYISVQFTPQTAGNLTGNLAIVVDGATTNVPLSGTGVASSQNVEFYPSSSVSFPDTPAGTTSGYQTIYFYNTGSASLVLDRTTISGSFSIYNTNCEATTIVGVTVDGLGTGGNCYVNVQFNPASVAQGLTGTLTFYYNVPGSSTVTQVPVTLTGNGISATGTIALNPSSLNFGTQPQGITSATQTVYIQNPGNSPVTVNSFSFTGTDASDYSVNYSNCGATPFTLSAGESNCFVYVQFTPGGIGTRGPATFSVSSSEGNQTATVTGAGVAASQALGITPTSMNFGPIVVGQQGGELAYLRNTGTAAITFSASLAITGTNAADFTVNPYNCSVSNGGTLAAGATCTIILYFAPSVAAAESATLTFSDSAGTQTLALSGTGVSTTPTLVLSNYLLSYSTQVAGTTSSGIYLYLYNYSGASITLGNVNIAGSFLVPNGYNSCNGQTVSNNSYCYVFVQFAPTAAGYQTGTLTFNNSSGTALAGVPSVPLAGYAVAPTYTANLSPTSLNFTAQQVLGTTSSAQYLYLYNTGNTPLTVGTVAGTDLGLAGATAEFSVYSANGGIDSCSGETVAPGSSCYVYMTFTPNAAGARTGTITFPVTYANSTTANLTANLSGNGVVEKDSAVLTPANVSFVDQTVGVVTNYSIPVYLNNSGNQPFTVGTLTSGGSNASDFTKSSDGCSGVTVAVGSYCQINLTFTPGAVGTRSATMTFPVTFKDAATQNVVLSMTGKGINGTKALFITPGSLQFPAEIQTQTSTSQSISVTNTSNLPVTIGTDTITGTNSTEFAISADTCSGANLAAYSGSCNITMTFTPAASATGARTATLNIADNSGGHTAALSGTAITAAQQIAVSQTTLAFGNQPAGSTSSTQIVYFTNQADTYVTINGAVLGGANAADFTIVNNNCVGQGQIQPRGSCYVSVNFAPPSGTANGAVTASITETDSATPGTHTITLTGTVVTAGPAVALSPSSFTFATQNVGSSSAAQNIGVTNTGTANLTITAVASTNSTEFPISSDGCSGSVLTPGQQCVFSVKFSPSYGGARSGSITVTDNATGSPQSLAVTGTGYGIPSTSFSPTSLTFGSTNIGVTSATQNITLSNPGTDTLAIASIALTGVHAGDYAQTNTCGATLAHGASCVITVSFTPTAAGTRAAYVTVTDNSNNMTGSTQTVALAGTGVAVPTATPSPTTLTFGSTDIGVSSAAQTVTITNSGTGSLTIASITIGGTNSGDFSETNTCGATLVAPPTSNCTISVTFKPLASGSRAATITITDNAGNVAGSTQTIALTGTGLGLPAAALNTPSLTFSNQNVNSTSAAQTITLSNAGTGALTIASIGFTGANPGDFATTNNCAGSVAAGGNCTISVTFTPTAVGSRTATLTVTDNAGNVAGSTQSAAVSGVGMGVPAATPSPTTVTFASQNVGTTSAAQTVTLNNGGSGVLTISSIAISGTNAGDFATTNNCAGSVTMSGSCTISITFSPTASGARSATLTINDNAGNTATSQTVALSGTGAGIPGAAVSPSTATFSNQNVGTSSAAQTITLSNAGSAALTVASIAISGTNAGDFATTNNCGGSVASGASCSIAVTFSPTAIGSRTATLTVTDNAGNTAGSTQTVSLSGTGVGVAAAAVSPGTVVFGDQNVGVTSGAQTITLSNSGTAALTIASVVISGTNATDFASSSACGASLAAGSSCLISVTFKPGAPGNRGALLTVTDNAGNVSGSTQVVSLTGTGVGVPTAGVSPASLTFGNTVVGNSASAQTVTLTNSGTGPLTISSIVIGGTDPGDFTDTTTCGASLAVSASCTVAVTFTPTATGTRTANLHVVDNSGNVGATQTVTITGSGIPTGASPIAGVSPSSLTFASTTVGGSALAQTVTLSNTGTLALAISGITVGGTNAGDFTQTNTCGTSLAASSSCSISVTFTPTAVGSRTATLSVADNSGNASSTQTVALSGTGITGSAAAFLTGYALSNPALRSNFTGYAGMAIQVGNNPLNVSNVGRVCVAGNAHTHIVEFVNATSGSTVTGGSATVSMAGCTAGQFVYAPVSVTLNAGATYYLVSQETNGGDQWYDSGKVSSTADATIPGAVYSSGSGWVALTVANYSYIPPNFQYSLPAPLAVVSPSSLTFANTTVGTTTAAQMVTITNSGQESLAISSITIGGANAGDFAQTNNCGASLAPSSSCAVSVTFTPTAKDSRTANLSVADNSGNMSSTQTVTLTGSASAIFLTGYALSNPALRNNFTGYAGMTVQVGSNALTVTSVGRVCVSGNTQTHIVKFVNASSGSDVSGGTATLNMAGCTAGQFVYGTVSVTLSAGTTYYLVSQETMGGDQWYDSGKVTSTTAATIPGAVYSSGSGWNPLAVANYSYIPPNFQYQ